MQDPQERPQHQDLSRYERGWQRLLELDSQGGQRILDGLQAIAPDLATAIIEFAFGDIYSRSGLDLKQRQLITLTALTTLGNSEVQLEFHLNAALNVGLEPDEIVEAFINCVPFIGVPRVFNALGVAKRVFLSRNIQRD
ncbi:MAG TPA: carboxymuconolactone decarboxylase family protein [Ktedonosporobacter sp.]|nr:carboxymuconolactone decarboxylase family protein [Ktedonosporobacter sp.]